MEVKERKLNGKILKDAFDKFTEAWEQKTKDQGNAETFNDHLIKGGLNLLSAAKDAIPWEGSLQAIFSKMEDYAPREDIESFVALVLNKYYGRFVDFNDRTTSSIHTSDDINLDFLKKSDEDDSFMMSQGRFDCLRWKDTIIFKTVYDLAIYQMMIWELKPKTIIEIGSGSGGSAIWMSDLTNQYNLDSHILSIDIYPPKMKYRNVSFIEGDVNQITSILDEETIKTLPHPWLVIEDAHVNVLNVLNHFHGFLTQGDYLVVEDSKFKQDVISDFLREKEQDYQVDTLYCDFFGQNLTCSHNSIFRRN
ncbi:CmcI family methyltransferase [Aquimarina spongiae]|uniref:Cephalosporin hydroxylase n=1 Tax=Aquimarina spongiae TaxID=570521 RepID=A0A1M6H0K5_9FLAO|nr:CmcI family methyltransferase [Aquimarina spongiae]SHJ15758.1 Cephalosporin hydroxylase [Aquimarina spongiae]